MQVSTAIFAAALSMFATQGAAVPADGTVAGEGRVTLITDIDVPADLPAQQGGVLREILVEEGAIVKLGQVLARVDNELEKISVEVALSRSEMAEKEATNDVNVRYAKMAANVQYFAHLSIMEAIDKVEDAYSKTEVNRSNLQWRQYVLQTEQAEHERSLAMISWKVRKAEYGLAQHELSRREIKCPVDEGVVVEVYFEEGEWVRAGDTVARIVKLDKLRIFSRLPYSLYTPAEVDGKSVNVVVPALAAKGLPHVFQGKIDQVKPMLDPGGAFEVRVVVQNERQGNHYLLMPGMQATVEIQPDIAGEVSR